jgi:hypothetical protein
LSNVGFWMGVPAAAAAASGRQPNFPAASSAFSAGVAKCQEVNFVSNQLAIYLGVMAGDFQGTLRAGGIVGHQRSIERASPRWKTLNYRR